MTHLRTLLLGTVVLTGALSGAGCSSDPQMSSNDAANFGGKKDGSPPSAAKQKAIADFQANFKKLHPETGAPGVPPAGK